MKSHKHWHHGMVVIYLVKTSRFLKTQSSSHYTLGIDSVDVYHYGSNFFLKKLTKFWLLKGRSSEWNFQRSGNIIHFWFPFWNSICKCIFTMYLISRNRWLGDVHWGRILAVELNGIQIRCGADTLRYLYKTQIWGRSILLSTASRLIATITMSKIIIMIKPWILNASESDSNERCVLTT